MIPCVQLKVVSNGLKGFLQKTQLLNYVSILDHRRTKLLFCLMPRPHVYVFRKIQSKSVKVFLNEVCQAGRIPQIQHILLLRIVGVSGQKFMKTLARNFPSFINAEIPIYSVYMYLCDSVAIAFRNKFNACVSNL